MNYSPFVAQSKGEAMEKQASLTRVKKSLGLSFRLAWIFGISNIQVPYILRIIYAAFLIIIFTGAYSFLLWMIIETLSTSVTPLNFNFTYSVAQIVIVGSIYSIIIVWVARGAKTVQETVVSLNEVDEIFEADHNYYRLFETNFRNQLWGMRLQILFCFALFLWDLEIGLRSDDNSFIFLLRKISYMIISTFRRTQLLVFNILFCAVIRTIHLRFIYINYVLYRMMKALDVDIPTHVQCFYKNKKGKTILRPVKLKTEEMVKEIKVLHKMHKRLRDITDNLTEGFWPCLASFLLSVLLLSIFHISRMIIRDIKIKDNWYSAAANNVVECAQTVAECWLVMSSCENLSNEANKFGRMLHIIDIPDPVFQRQLQELSLIHSQDKVIVTAGGLFNIELPRLIYILSSLFGYAVIVYQMN